MAGIHATAQNMTNTPRLRANPPRSPAAPGVLNRRPRWGISGHGQPPAAGPAWTPRWALLGRAWGPGPRGHRRPGPDPSPVPCCPLLSPSLSSKAEKPPPSPMGEGPPTVPEDTSPHPPAAARIISPAPPPIPAAAKGSGRTWGRPQTGRPGGVRPWLGLPAPTQPPLDGGAEKVRSRATLCPLPERSPSPPPSITGPREGPAPFLTIVRTVPGSSSRCVALKQRTRPMLPTPSAGRSAAGSEGQ